MKRLLTALLALATTACVTGSDIEKLQSQIADLQEQVAQMKRTSAGKEEVQSVNQRIAEQTQTLLKSNAALVAKVDQIDTDAEAGGGLLLGLRVAGGRGIVRGEHDGQARCDAGLAQLAGLGGHALLDDLGQGSAFDEEGFAHG